MFIGPGFRRGDSGKVADAERLVLFLAPLRMRPTKTRWPSNGTAGARSAPQDGARRLVQWFTHPEKRLAFLGMKIE